MQDIKLQFDQKVEKIRLDLINYIEELGVKQSFFCKKTGLSGCSISLFIASKRLLVKDKLDIISSIIYKNK